MTGICQVGKGAEAKTDQVVVKWVEFAEGWDVQDVTKQVDIALKGALTGDEFADKMGKIRVVKLNLIEPEA